MKEVNFFKIYIPIITILVIVLCFFAVRLNEKNENLSKNSDDGIRFQEEYSSLNGKTSAEGIEYPNVNLDSNNLYNYASENDIIEVLKSKTGVVYLGFPECQWCQQYVVYLNEVAKARGISTIYYYNIRQDRTDNTEEYQRIVNLLKDYLEEDEEGNPRIYVPAVILVRNGDIIGFDDETAYDTEGFDTPSEYWTEDKVDALKDRLNSYIDDSGICISCNS